MHLRCRDVLAGLTYDDCFWTNKWKKKCSEKVGKRVVNFLLCTTDWQRSSFMNTLEFWIISLTYRWVNSYFIDKTHTVWHGSSCSFDVSVACEREENPQNQYNHEIVVTECERRPFKNQKTNLFTLGFSETDDHRTEWVVRRCATVEPALTWGKSLERRPRDLRKRYSEKRCRYWAVNDVNSERLS